MVLMKKMRKLISFILTFVFVSSQLSVALASNAFDAGVYSGVGQGMYGDVEVEVVLSEEGIEDITVVTHSDTEGIADLAVEKIPERILELQTTDVETVTGATMTSNGIIEGVNDALAHAGIDVNSLVGIVREDTEVAEEEISTDIVVIGAGAAGVAAALAAQDQGASVILLEKTAVPMGASTLAGGMFAVDSQQQKDLDKVVDKEWVYEQYLTASQGFMNSVLVRRIIDESGSTVDWLNGHGADLKLIEQGAGSSFVNVGKPATLHGYQKPGYETISDLINEFENLGGQVFFSTPATDIIIDSDNTVTGVVAKKEDGTLLTVNAQQVIIATGGFGGNQEMLDEFVGVPNKQGEVLHNQGDGILMAWEAGAAEKGSGSTHYFWETFQGDEIGEMMEVVGDSWFDLTDFTPFPFLRVNLNGQRFSDETQVTNFALHGAEIAFQPEQTEYIIIDSSALDLISQGGLVEIEDHFSQWQDDRQFFYEFNLPNDTDGELEYRQEARDYQPLLDDLTATSLVFKSDTLEGLAQEMDMDEENFINSVEQYNAAVETGSDELYFSDPERLVPLLEGPFYAIKFGARNLGTLGGVQINEFMQATNYDGSLIPGLYVVGADAGGMYGQRYVDIEGGTLGFAFISGRLAGIDAANNLSE